MWKLRQAQRYRDENKGDDGGSGGGGGKIDFDSPEVKAALQAKIDEAVTGLKSKNAELIAKEKKLKEQVAQFDGVDLEKIKNLQKQIAENEEMRLLSEGKLEEVVARRTENALKAKDSEIGAKDAKLTEYEKLLKKKEEKLAELVIDGQIREAYIALDYEPTALDYVLMEGRKVFVMDDKGIAIPKDEHGNTIFGKDAKSPISAKEYLEGLVEKKPFLRKPSKGSGTQGNSGSRTFGDLSSTGKIAAGLKELGM